MCSNRQSLVKQYNDISFIKIETKNITVFVDKSVVSLQQLTQVMAEQTVIVSKHDIKPNDNQIVIKPMASKERSNGGKIGGNCSEVLNETNVDTNCDKPLKRKLRPKRCQRNCKSIEKKSKFDLNFSENENNLNVLTISAESVRSLETKNKENQNNLSSELSRVIGLPNMGNTCYLNSIIQVLRITPGFKQFICFLNKSIENMKNSNKLNENNKQLVLCLHKIFVNFVDNQLNGDDKPTDPSTNETTIDALIDCKLLKDQFEFGRQHDCHEFLHWLINELNHYSQLLFPTAYKQEVNVLTKTHYRIRGKKQSVSFQSFQGVMLSTIVCSECNGSYFTDDSFADIQIPFCVAEDSIAEGIDNIQTFTEIIHRRDHLKDDNMFECRKCKKKTNASVVNSIKVPPKVLILFINKPLDCYSKTTRSSKPIKRLFTAPLELNYSSAEHSIQYSLYSFVMHSGANINNGHYYAVINSSSLPTQRVENRKSVCNCDYNVLSDNSWLKINDNKVNRINNSVLNRLLKAENMSPTPYLAFYERKN